MIPNQSHFSHNNLELLFSCSDEVELNFIIGLLEENNIEVFVDTGGIDEENKIYIPKQHLADAKQLLQASQKVFENIEYGDIPLTDSVNWKKVISRILFLLTSLFFGILSYYTLTTSEKNMGIFLGGLSVCFLLVFIFSFDWKHYRNGSR